MKDRKHLTSLEIEKLLAATKGGRNEARDWCLLFIIDQMQVIDEMWQP